MLFQIRGRSVEFDTDKEYLDFFIDNGQPTLVKIDFEKMLRALACGEVDLTDDIFEFWRYLERWTREAPRKRFFREMKTNGAMVLSNEVWFEDEGGDKIIDNLENTGNFAKYLLNTFLWDQWKPLYAQDGGTLTETP